MQRCSLFLFAAALCACVMCVPQGAYAAEIGKADAAPANASVSKERVAPVEKQAASAPSSVSVNDADSAASTSLQPCTPTHPGAETQTEAGANAKAAVVDGAAENQASETADRADSAEKAKGADGSSDDANAPVSVHATEDGNDASTSGAVAAPGSPSAAATQAPLEPQTPQKSQTSQKPQATQAAAISPAPKKTTPAESSQRKTLSGKSVRGSLKTAAQEENATTGQEEEAAASQEPSVSYRAYVQRKGWQAAVTSGTMGTTGKALRLEALKVVLNAGTYAGDVQAQVRVQNLGWQIVKSGGKMAGTKDKKLGIRALRLALTGAISRYYDIVYRAHVQAIGWQSWVSNGALAGTLADALRVEAVEIKLVKKEARAKKEGEGLVDVRYRTRSQNEGWQETKSFASEAGTTGSGLRLKKLQIWLDAGTLKGKLQYRAHVQNKGWLPWATAGEKTGATGNLRVEAIKIRLRGAMAKKYDVVYAAHVQDIGWQYKRFNGNTAGTTGQARRIEALWVNLVKRSERSGWYGSGKKWKYYQDGKALKRQWLVTGDSPIQANPGTQRYWLDRKGNLAVSRLIKPNTARDKGSWLAYATPGGYAFCGGISKILGTWYYASTFGRLSKVGNIGNKVVEYTKWAIGIANDDAHGYSQRNRLGPDYDCSSLVISALKAVGFFVGEAIYTGNMVSELTKYGFRYYTDLRKLRTGDILWVHNNARQHTEIYLGGGQVVGATGSETGGIDGLTGDQTGREIRIGNYYNAPWMGFLRAS